MSIAARGESNGVADRLQSFGEPFCRALRVAPVKVVAAAFVILDSGLGQDVPGDDENAMRHRHGCLLHTAPLRGAKEQSS